MAEMGSGLHTTAEPWTIITSCKPNDPSTGSDMSWWQSEMS